MATLTIFRVKMIHTIIFWILSVCVLLVLHDGVTGRVTTWTWAAVALVVVESAVLAAFGGTCPLTILAERLGAERGAVTDIFLPKWFADRIFPICGTTFVVGVALVVVRVLR